MADILTLYLQCLHLDPLRVRPFSIAPHQLQYSITSKKFNRNCLEISITQTTVFEQSNVHTSSWIRWGWGGRGEGWKRTCHCSLTSPHPSPQSEGTGCQQLLIQVFSPSFLNIFFLRRKEIYSHYRKCRQ